jgi:uncharacterized membrane protein YhhN
LYVVLIAASIVNLTASFIADVTLPPEMEPTGLPRLLIWLSKPLLIPALAGILFLNTRGADSSIRLSAFYMALLFCWVGDIALMLGKTYFLWGVGAFGVAHLFFIRAYLKGIDLGSAFNGKAVVFGLPFLVYGYILYCTIFHHLKGNPLMQVAIGIYTLVLLSNGVSAFLRMHLLDLASSPYILVGVVLFVQSDSIIAMTTFVDTLPLERFSIMATYILGQYLMVRGCIIDCSARARQPEASPVPLLAAA